MQHSYITSHDRNLPCTSAVFGLLFSLLLGFQSITHAEDVNITARLFTSLINGNDEQQNLTLQLLNNKWHPSFAGMLIETISLVRNRDTYELLVSLLEEKTGQQIGYDSGKWFEWAWEQPYEPNPDYAAFKSALYSLISPKFAGYFGNDKKSLIRLDEVRWGGVLQDGIPPLRQPNMIRANQADYLDDSNIVFGIEVNGDVRAYPKRILAWHEMFVDEVGGISIAGVYCTLCGTVIIYDTLVDGVQYEMGTSGFLYRSNKLMYDQATQSLWSTFEGKPVIGPLVDQGIKFASRSVVTTTWGEWKRRHPQSKVLDLKTGFQRDYGEGVAYKDYFASDDLMFSVPKLDQRLNNKDEILGLILPEHPDKPLAISVKYLDQNPVYHDQIGQQKFVALTDKSGAIRIFENPGLTFTKWDRDQTASDQQGRIWTLSEAKLTADDGTSLARLPANRAF